MMLVLLHLHLLLVLPMVPLLMVSHLVGNLDGSHYRLAIVYFPGGVVGGVLAVRVRSGCCTSWRRRRTVLLLLLILLLLITVASVAVLPPPSQHSIIVVLLAVGPYLHFTTVHAILITTYRLGIVIVVQNQRVRIISLN